MAQPPLPYRACEPAIAILPDEIIHHIIARCIDDPKDLASCLLAWRRFHVLNDADIVARRCRYATLLSLCAVGDIDGLRYAASRSDVFGPVAGFRWDACLYAASIRDHVDVLDHLKGRIIEVAAGLPPAPDLDPEPPIHLHANELRAMRMSVCSRAVDAPTWPPSPALWLALPVGAAHHGCERALGWLCAEGNRPTHAPTLRCVLSAHEMTLRGGSLGRGDALLWLRMRIDSEVLLAIRRVAHTMDGAAMRAIAECVSTASGLDIVGLLRQSVESIGDDAGETLWGSQMLDDYLGRPKETDLASDRLAHEAVADPANAPVDAVNAAWAAVARGGLAALRAQYGDDAVAATLNRHPIYPAQVLSLFVAMAEPYTGSSTVDFAKIDLPWPSLCDDVMWLHRRASYNRERDPVFYPMIDSVIVPALHVMMALVGRRDLMDELGDEAASASDEPPLSGRALLSTIGRMYPCVAVAAICRGDLDTARWACARMGSGGARAAWSAWRDGHSDAVRFLYAHGCDRAPTRARDTYTKSPLYASLCARDTEAVDALLDPTAADDAHRDAVDRAIAAAVAWAAEEALVDGNLRVIIWLHRRYSGIVDEVLAEARATRTPSLIPVASKS
ncbi:hypothetical protein psal_cds_1384 [Pandoravirus salinus]|uniref:Ankyrin repeat domain containing protein n=1 Tax=Pandoravirus salinus TaxID=1349410 RepID=S4W5W4_9VIRU|nr:hypothetical protein psal_cds_1384 [Pandoravirus salinus]AGO85795.1 hypothetical protein psal_cds_1384 [Pandoravirus salinus]